MPRFTLIVLLLLFAGRADAQSINVIPPTGEWVVDTAGMFTEGERQSLSLRLSRYADTTSTQIGRAACRERVEDSVGGGPVEKKRRQDRRGNSEETERRSVAQPGSTEGDDARERT